MQQPPSDETGEPLGHPGVPPPPSGMPPPPPGFGPPGGFSPPPAYGYSPGAMGAPRDPMAVWALVASILGFCCCPPASIAGAIMGYLVYTRVRAGNGMTGDAMALAAMIIGAISLVLTVLAIIVNVASGGGSYHPTNTYNSFGQ